MADIDDGSASAFQLSILDLDCSSLSHIFSLTLALHHAALRAAADQEHVLALRRRDPRRLVPCGCFLLVTQEIPSRAKQQARV